MARKSTLWNAALIRRQLSKKAPCEWFLGQNGLTAHGKVKSVELCPMGLKLHITGGKKPGKLIWKLPREIATLCV